MFVLVTFILLLSALGLVSAVDVSNNITNTTISGSSVVSDGTSYVEKQANYVNNSNDNLNSSYISNNKIYSKNTSKTISNNVLGDSQVSVGSFAELQSAVNTANTGTYGVYTITLTSNITSTSTLSNWARESSSTNLVINGNGYTINGSNNYRFMSINGNTNVTYENVIFTNFNDKTKDAGGTGTNGALGYVGGNLTLVNCTVRYSKASGDGADGGVFECGGTLNIYDSTFLNNSANDAAGVLMLRGSGCIANVVNSVFINNSAARDGVVEAYDGAKANFTNCIFINNKADRDSGVLTIKDSVGQVNITGCCFENNTCVQDTSRNAITAPNSAVITNNTLIGSSQTISGGKQSSNEIDQNVFYVSTFAELQSAINNANTLTGNVIIILNNSISCTSQLSWTRDSSSTNLTIKGMGYTITGSTNRFMNSTAGTNVTISDVHFKDFKRSGFYGGCIYTAGNLTIKSCSFNNCNITTTGNSPDDAAGGAIYSHGNLTVISSNFTNCKALQYTADGGAINTNGKNLTVINSNFINCSSASDGGAISTWNSVNNIINNTFINNSAGSSKHGAFTQYNSGSGNVSGNLFINNTPLSVDIHAGTSDVSSNTVNGGGAISGGTQTNNIVSGKIIYVSTYAELQSAWITANSSTGNVTIVFTANLTSAGMLSTWSRNSSLVNLTIDGNGFTINGTNNYRFMNIAGNTNVTYKNIVFTNLVDKSRDNNANGGVGYVVGNLTIINSTIMYCKSSGSGGDGGAFEIVGNFSAYNSSFLYNYANDAAGVLMIHGSSTFDIVNCVFLNNSAGRDGVIETYEYAKGNFTNCSFMGNHASDTRADTSGVFEISSNCVVNITGCYFENNYCNNGIGDLYSYTDSTILTNNTLNTSNIGGSFNNGAGNVVVSPVVVSSWLQLVSAVSNASSVTNRIVYSIYLNSSANFNASSVLSITSPKSVGNLFIYGNGSLLNGSNTYSFFRVSGVNLYVYDLNLTNFKNTTGSLINVVNGSLSLSKVSVNNSTSVGRVFACDDDLTSSNVQGNVSVTVNNNNNFTIALNEAKNFTNGSYTINSNFYLVGVSSEFVWGGSVGCRELVLNFNGRDVVGSGVSRFVSVASGYSLSISRGNFSGFVSSGGGVVSCVGNLSVVNSSFVGCNSIVNFIIV